MPNAPNYVQIIASTLAMAGVVASAAKYTGVWTVFMTRDRRAIKNGDLSDVEAAVDVVNAPEPQAVIALDTLPPEAAFRQPGIKEIASIIENEWRILQLS